MDPFRDTQPFHGSSPVVENVISRFTTAKEEE
jgi:hypothetical protein